MIAPEPHINVILNALAQNSALHGRLHDAMQKCEIEIRTLTAICWERHLADVRDVLLTFVVVFSCALQLSTAVALFRKPACNCRQWASQKSRWSGELRSQHPA